jgi:hypothetical protein
MEDRFFHVVKVLIFSLEKTSQSGCFVTISSLATVILLGTNALKVYQRGSKMVFPGLET